MAAPPKMRRLAAKGFNVPQELKPFVNQLLDTTNSFFADTSNALNKRLTLAANVVSEVKSVEVYAPEPTWTAITTFDTTGITNNGGGYQTAQYRIEPGGIVRVQCLLSGVSTASTQLFTLPVGYRPGAHLEVPCSAGGGVPAILTIFSTGIFTRAAAAQTFAGFNVEYPATTPATPAAFSGVGWPIVLQPQRVQMRAGESPLIPLRYVDADNLNASVPTFTPDWSLDANGNVVIKSIWGLTPGKRYRLDFLLIE